MRTRMCLAIGAFALLPIFSVGDHSADDRVREAAQRFMSAFKSKDVAAIVKAAAVPWFHDGKRIIKNHDELAKEFQQLFDKKTDFSSLRFEIRHVVSYRTIREKTPPEERKLLDQVVTADDWAVLLSMERPERKKETIVLLVRSRGGETKVVGIND